MLNFSKKSIIILSLIYNCFNGFGQYPVPSPNPWKDDYSEISAFENYQKWGTYNVHDPAVIRVDGVFYMYSTDAIFHKRRNPGDQRQNIKIGNIQIRSSENLVNWKFEGWAFDSIPKDAKQWVLAHSNQKGATNIWAPYPVRYKNKFRLYYCVSAFGLQTSYIGLAESETPIGPWTLKGEVVKTKLGDLMNAIDPSIVSDPVTGKMWMHYGSYFGGLYVVQLNPESGLTLRPGDQGSFVATRANIRKDNIEAPEIIYNPELKKYFLFTSYDPLMTTYNVRVGRADKPEGPFTDFFGNDLRDTINHFPILTHPYQFKNHTGWAGTGHCGVFTDEKGNFFMVHQGRLAPDNQLMVLHVREIKWTKNGWPVVSPQRYSANKNQLFSKSAISKKDILGTWEIIRIQDAKTDRKLEFGQILWGEGQLRPTEINGSKTVEFTKNGTLKGSESVWKFSTKSGLTLKLKHETITNLMVFRGHDWENETETLLFSGLDKNGCSVWGKKVK